MAHKERFYQYLKGSLWLCILFSQSSLLTAQTRSGEWKLGLGWAMVSPYGEYAVQRNNGKQVRTDVEPGVAVRLDFSKTIGERAFIHGAALLFARHRIVLDQTFPDGASFQSSDQIRPTYLFVGWGYSLVAKNSWQLDVAADISYVLFNDISLASAGPPYDRSLPLDIQSRNSFRGGVHFNSSFYFGKTQSFGIGLKAGLLLNRFQGEFPTEDEVDPLSDIDLAFNPLWVSVSLLRVLFED